MRGRAVRGSHGSPSANSADVCPRTARTRSLAAPCGGPAPTPPRRGSAPDPGKMRTVDINTGNLRDLARVIVEHLHANGFPAEGGANRQVLALAEECGEFVGAYRRWSGQARRGGTAEE